MVIKKVYFQWSIKEKSNALDTGGICLSFIWEFVIVASRVIVVLFSIRMQIWSNTQEEFDFSTFCW
jgi:hypothetical protein